MFAVNVILLFVWFSDVATCCLNCLARHCSTQQSVLLQSKDNIQFIWKMKKKINKIKNKEEGKATAAFGLWEHAAPSTKFSKALKQHYHSAALVAKIHRGITPSINTE